ncbi:carbohydrate ABC transporter permease [Ruminiclostridium cellobioparum]|uniref:ABC-type sugar transport system, permease component n=1 Tax=Ruminiclostridium cellobioparum subsp. termitidis CT1112 TaxID=1195236 RepID=S0FMD5_RUMCE|nr:carbohydrate ABC transporter permease [Ruminiclostridium cellobioparum]EMS70299.1 ABC-type sugar transport system, permease component [Ruminiclostridium cellobioparum subsp. termitidis CT1112]
MSLYKSYGGNKRHEIIYKVISIAFLLLFAVATLFPIYFMIISSFGDPIEAGAVNYSLIPTKFTLDSFKFFFNYSEYSVRWLLNSLLIASVATISNVVFAGMAGYAFSKIKFPGRKWLFFLLLIAMMIPYQVVQVPLYILIVNIFNLSNTYASLMLPTLCGVYNIFLAKQFMSTLPTEVIECAKIEGCNQFQIFTKIIVPLSKTVLAVMAIMTFMENWNTFFWPFLVTKTMDMQTIQVGLKNFRFANTTYFSPMMAGATISAIPMFILFFSLQKYFLQGVTVGAVKG